MSFAIDIAGQQFGRLTAVSKESIPTGRGTAARARVFWLCLCECGNTTIVDSNSLRTGNTRSCGCLVHEIRADQTGEVAKRDILRAYKNSAKRKTLVWALSDRQALYLMSQSCAYCGAPPKLRRISRSKKAKANHAPAVVNGIDRIENDKGYECGNVVACCWTCNRLKGSMPFTEWDAWLGQVARHYIGGIE